jgi:hypothetical protein
MMSSTWLARAVLPAVAMARIASLVQENNRIKGLSLGAGRDTLLSQSRQKPFQFLFTRQMSRKPFEVVAILPEPGAVTVLRGLSKMHPPNDFRKARHRFFGIHPTILKYEPPRLDINC